MEGNQGGANDFIAEVGAQVRWSAQVDFSIRKETAEFLFHAGEAKESDVVAGLELEKDRYTKAALRAVPKAPPPQDPRLRRLRSRGRSPWPRSPGISTEIRESR